MFALNLEFPPPELFKGGGQWTNSREQIQWLEMTKWNHVDLDKPLCLKFKRNGSTCSLPHVHLDKPFLISVVSSSREMVQLAPSITYT